MRRTLGPPALCEFFADEAGLHDADPGLADGLLARLLDLCGQVQVQCGVV
jgi:hypothetical protein